ncbi:MAG: two-component response regulator MtrA, partial [Actinomycetota bacterium]
RAALRRTTLLSTAMSTTERFTVGEIDFRPHQGVVLKNGVELPLTKTEYRLLQTFFENQNNVLSRDQLLEIVWGYEYLGDSRLVDAHIRRLRVKIEKSPDDPKIIVTVRGTGYRLLTA